MFENKAMEKPFPANLYFAMTGKDPPEADDMTATIMYLLYRIPPNKRDMVLSRYKHGMSFRKIGELYGFSGAYAESAIAECVRSMGQNSRILRVGINEAMTTNQEALKASEAAKIANKCRSEGLKEGYEAGYSDAINGIKDSEPAKHLFDSITVAELNLSNRSANALYRERIETVSDIVKRGNDIACIRALGKGSLSEIVLKLNGLGVDVRKHFARVIGAYDIKIA